MKNSTFFHRSGILDMALYDRTLKNIITLTLKEGIKVTVITRQQKGLKGTIKELVDQDTIRVEFSIDNQVTSTMDLLNLYVKVSDYEVGNSVQRVASLYTMEN